MPVTTLVLERFSKLLGKSLQSPQFIDRLPYIGLDIESVSDSEVRVEYSPNRPDFSTDVGIARALAGLLGIQKGCPIYRVAKSSAKIKVDRSAQQVRPFVVGAVITGLQFDDETIRQVIAMQEDLHNGIGRQRTRVAIGFHNFDKIKPPITYLASNANRSFLPLGSTRSMTIQQILEQTEQGRIYGKLLQPYGRFPLLIDSKEDVLSMPPIINSDLTKIDKSVTDVFVDVTGTDLRASSNALNVIVTTFSDMGGKISSIEIQDEKKSAVTPNLDPTTERLNMKLVSQLLGINLNRKQAVDCLGRARLGSRIQKGNLIAVIPAYRFDIIHPVDLVEEIAIGFGIDKLVPSLPAWKSAGQLSSKQSSLSCIREICVGCGLEEVAGYSLIPTDLARSFSERQDLLLVVEGTKSLEHEVLKPSLIPGLLSCLGLNTGEKYPQKIFEIGIVFDLDSERGNVIENTRLCVALAHPDADFTEIKSYLESILFQVERSEQISTLPRGFQGFAPGRSAKITMEGLEIGRIGEISPAILRLMSVKMPTAAFEMDLKPLLRWGES